MAALAAHGIKLYAKASSASAVSGDEIDGISEATFSPARDVLETTDFKDSEAKTKILALKDGSISISGDYESADAPQALLLSSWSDGSSVWITILWNGTTGHKVECKVESFEIGGAVADKVTFSASLTFTAAFTAV